MSPQHTSPQQSPPPPSSSPGSTFYPSGVPAGFQGYSPQQGAPYQPFPGSQGQMYQQGDAYNPQQQQAYGGGGWQHAPVASPPSPPHQQATELQTINPLGMSTNRAEIG